MQGRCLDRKPQPGKAHESRHRLYSDPRRAGGADDNRRPLEFVVLRPVLLAPVSSVYAARMIRIIVRVRIPCRRRGDSHSQGPKAGRVAVIALCVLDHRFRLRVVPPALQRRVRLAAVGINPRDISVVRALQSISPCPPPARAPPAARRRRGPGRCFGGLSLDNSSPGLWRTRQMDWQ